MCVRYLGFVLLVWFAAVLRAQSATQPCDAPTLTGGYFVPEDDTYSHGTKLSYACNNGRKLTVEGWWATSTCQNGTWSHEPQCIDEGACIKPEIPNAKYTENSNGWYEDGNIIRITCDEGYAHKKRDATARCTNGLWTSVPVCEKSINACGEPPIIPHAVIIDQEYQEVFAVDSVVQYECEDGYTVEGADSEKSIVCIAGNWNEGPPCIIRPGTGHGGSEVGGTAGEHTTSADRETRPGTGHGGSATGGTAGEHTTSADRETRPVSNCGRPPIVSNSVVESYQMSLKYQCVAFYKRVGPETVVCYSGGTWSKLPTCRDSYCAVDTTDHPALKSVGVKYIKDGETVRLKCLDEWWFDNYSEGRCTDGKLTLTRCCNKIQLNTNTC